MRLAVDTVPFVDLAAERERIRHELDDAVRTVLDSGQFILGRELAAFEEEFACYCGVGHCVGVGSGTDALILALRACGIGPGDEVITPSFTFVAGPLAIVTVGAVPVFVDVDELTATLNVELVEKSITERTRAIVPVHLYGRCANVDPLAALARERGLWLIEDAAQAHGARTNGRAAGAVGHLGCFSFYPSKNLGAFGDGGAVITDDPKLAHSIRLLRNYGQTEKYHHESLGTNSRLDELQAAILRKKLTHLDSWNSARRRAVKAYTTLLDPDLTFPLPDEAREHVLHLYVIRTIHRDALRRFLSEHGVQTGVHYPLPVHRQPAFRGLPHVAGALPITDRLADEVLSLPMFSAISPEQINYVADRVREGLARVDA